MFKILLFIFFISTLQSGIIVGTGSVKKVNFTDDTAPFFLGSKKPYITDDIQHMLYYKGNDSIYIFDFSSEVLSRQQNIIGGRYITPFYYSNNENLLLHRGDGAAYGVNYLYNTSTTESINTSIGPNGSLPDCQVRTPYIDKTHNWIAFASCAKNWGAYIKYNDRLFLRNLDTQTTIAIDTNHEGGLVNGEVSGKILILNNPLSVIYSSDSTDILDEDDTNDKTDIYMYDINTQTTKRVSKDENNNQLTQHSFVLSEYNGTLIFETRTSTYGTSEKIYKYELTTDTVTELFKNKYNGTIRSVSKDGNRVLSTVYDGTHHYYVYDRTLEKTVKVAEFPHPPNSIWEQIRFLGEHGNQVLYIFSDTKEVFIQTLSFKAPPTANARQDQTVPFGQAVRLGTDVTAGIVSYEWKEGSTVLSTSMSFDKSDFSIGTHTVTLTVTDDHNVSATDSVDVTVSSVTTLQEGVGAYEFVGNSVYPYKYYTFTIGSMSKVSIHTIKGQLGEDDINDTDGWLYDENGSILSSVSDFDAGEDNHLKIEKVLQPGAYFIKVFGSNGAMGHYVIGFDAQPYDANLAWGIHIPQKINVIQGGVVDLPLEIVAQNENAKFKNLKVRSNTAMVGMWLEKGKETWKLLGHINGGAFDINLTVYDNVTGFSKNVNITLEPDAIKIDGVMGAGLGNSVMRVTNGGEIAETFKVAFDISGTDIRTNLDRVECIVGSSQPLTMLGYWFSGDGDKVRYKCHSEDDVFNAKLLQLPDDERYLSIKIVMNDASEIVKKNVMKIEPYLFEKGLSLQLIDGFEAGPSLNIFGDYSKEAGELLRHNGSLRGRDFPPMYKGEIRYFEHGDSLTMVGGLWKLQMAGHEFILDNRGRTIRQFFSTGDADFYAGGFITTFNVTKDLDTNSSIFSLITELDGNVRFVGKNMRRGAQSSSELFIKLYTHLELVVDKMNFDEEPDYNYFNDHVAGVRGTTFKMDISEGSTKTSVYEGIVDILDENITLNTMQEYNSSSIDKQNIQKMALSEQEKVYLKKTSLYSADSNKSVGSIVVNTNLSLAQYILIGKDTQVNGGTLSHFVNVAEGNYTLRFLPVEGYISPNDINLELNQANLNQEKSVVYLQDTDNDGISNSEDTDDDNDGVLDVDDAFPLNPNESVDTDHDGVGNNADKDDDNDGISDALEIVNGLNPLNPSDAGQDNDGDGVSNADEIEAGSDPLDADDTKKPKRFVPIMMDDMMIMVPLTN